MFGEQDAATLMGEILENGINENEPAFIDNLKRYSEISKALERKIGEYLSAHRGSN